MSVEISREFCPAVGHTGVISVRKHPCLCFVPVSVLIGGDSPGYTDYIRASSMGGSLGNTHLLILWGYYTSLKQEFSYQLS
jgi:hypothetical protein